jgi:hypothetical protein
MTLAMLQDLTGKKFGKWTVTGRGQPGYWLCTCECGCTRQVRGDNLKKDRSRSCISCREFRNSRPKNFNAKTYDAWRYIRRSYSNIDREWIDYRVFLREVGEPPDEKHWLRVSNKHNVVNKDNVKWTRLAKTQK